MKGAFKLHPRLVGKEAEGFVYGYNLKRFPDEPIKVGVHRSRVCSFSPTGRLALPLPRLDVAPLSPPPHAHTTGGGEALERVQEPLHGLARERDEPARRLPDEAVSALGLEWDGWAPHGFCLHVGTTGRNGQAWCVGSIGGLARLCLVEGRAGRSEPVCNTT